MALRTNAKDAELRRYLRDEFPNSVPAWLRASVPDEALRLRPRLRRRIGRWIGARRVRRTASRPQVAEPA